MKKHDVASKIVELLAKENLSIREVDDALRIAQAMVNTCTFDFYRDSLAQADTCKDKMTPDECISKRLDALEITVARIAGFLNVSVNRPF